MTAAPALASRPAHANKNVPAYVAGLARLNVTEETVAAVAGELMAHHGLCAWSFAFDRALTRYGCCRHSKRRITLSRQWIERERDWGRIVNTLLHEIAHALVGPRHGHDATWRAKALEIGSNGKRCSHYETLPDLEPRWAATCRQCGHVHYAFRRSTCSCGRCDRRWRPDLQLEWVPVQQHEVAQRGPVQRTLFCMAAGGVR